MPEKFGALNEQDVARLRELQTERDTQYRGFLEKPEEERAEAEREERKQRFLLVRRRLGQSFLLVAAAAALGWTVGRAVGWAEYCVLAWGIGALQIAGTGLLLWAVLFVLGWEIQTIGGGSLTEHVNQWIYRFLSFVGTVILLVAISMPLCS